MRPTTPLVFRAEAYGEPVPGSHHEQVETQLALAGNYTLDLATREAADGGALYVGDTVMALAGAVVHSAAAVSHAVLGGVRELREIRKEMK